MNPRYFSTIQIVVRAQRYNVLLKICKKKAEKHHKNSRNNLYQFLFRLKFHDIFLQLHFSVSPISPTLLHKLRFLMLIGFLMSSSSQSRFIESSVIGCPKSTSSMVRRRATFSIMEPVKA